MKKTRANVVFALLGIFLAAAFVISCGDKGGGGPTGGETPNIPPNNTQCTQGCGMVLAACPAANCANPPCPCRGGGGPVNPNTGMYEIITPSGTASNLMLWARAQSGDPNHSAAAGTDAQGKNVLVISSWATHAWDPMGEIFAPLPVKSDVLLAWDGIYFEITLADHPDLATALYGINYLVGLRRGGSAAMWQMRQPNLVGGGSKVVMASWATAIADDEGSSPSYPTLAWGDNTTTQPNVSAWLTDVFPANASVSPLLYICVQFNDAPPDPGQAQPYKAYLKNIGLYRGAINAPTKVGVFWAPVFD